MKKLLVAAIAAVAGVFVYRRVQASRDEQALWAEATDSVE
jgi:hypothetical protein